MTIDADSGTSPEIVRVASLDDLTPQLIESAFATYRGAFSHAPYSEDFTPETSRAALQFILSKAGDLLLGVDGGTVVALAGGYAKSAELYYVEELAVLPECQGRGYGRYMLRALVQRAQSARYSRLEIRTTALNTRAISLYESEGFIRQERLEAVAQLRANGVIELDARVYLSNPAISQPESENSLKRVVVTFPSGNTTALVFDQLLDLDRKDLNERLMAATARLPDVPANFPVEQCGFVTFPKDDRAIARVEMMGGEFCGNATRSAAFLVTRGQNYAGLIECSGVDRPLSFSVEAGKVSLEMPLPDDMISLVVDVDEGKLVNLDGITHLVLPWSEEINTRDIFDRLRDSNAYGLADQPAVGITQYDVVSGKAEFLVWVNAVDSLFDETACGSGTCAIAVAAAYEQGSDVTLNVVQPSGMEIRASALMDKDRKIVGAGITGDVNVIYDGELTL